MDCGVSDMRAAVLGALSFPPGGFNPNTDISYTGSITIIDEGNGNWHIELKTDGITTILKDPGPLDYFLLGGGGGGGSDTGGGGGGGYVNTQLNKTITVGTEYTIDIGAGGNGGTGGYDGTNGSATTAFGYTANGGLKGGSWFTARGVGGNGGSGGGGYNGAGGSNGANGAAGTAVGGTGSGATTKEFAESSGTLYATGGDGGVESPVAGSANTGDGGDGGKPAVAGAAGGSGIVVIRNHRAA